MYIAYVITWAPTLVHNNNSARFLGMPIHINL